MVEFVLKSGIIIIALHMFLFFIDTWIDLFDDADEDYEYCYNCPHGMCIESPKSERCKKWRSENESKNK